MSEARTESSQQTGRLADISPELELMLTTGAELPEVFSVAEIQRQTVMVPMRDGVRLATDLFLPPQTPAPVIVCRTPYDRASEAHAEARMAFARAGYVVVCQDVRGTGASEPDHWDWRVYEREDSYDCVEWVVAQDWCGDFIGSYGGSYLGLTQWEMARHPRMSTIAPEVGPLISAATQTAHFHLFLDAYSRSVGKGEGKVGAAYVDIEKEMHEETLATGYYNDPLDRPFPEPLLARFPDLRTLNSPAAQRDWLWARFNELPPRERAELLKLALSTNIVTLTDHDRLDTVFGRQAPFGRSTRLDPRSLQIARALKAPAFVITSWYNWTTRSELDSWDLVANHAEPEVAAHSRLMIGPDAHNVTGYHEGQDESPELQTGFRTQNVPDLLLHWYATVRNGTFDAWPRALYYLMGANEWRAASHWPPREAKPRAFYLGADGTLTTDAPMTASAPDRYIYDPTDPAPTLGGSICSSVIPPGSVDVSEAQQRPDVLTYTTPPLAEDLDVVGDLTMVLYASSSAVDTDFCARLTDVFPDGRAIQLQSNVLRARFRDPGGEPELIEPGKVYRFEIDLCATANRFKAGHRLRVDISSADFPKFDRNSNRGGEPGDPIRAEQTIFHDAEHPSHLMASVLC